jgi:hypothetical protein
MAGRRKKSNLQKNEFLFSGRKHQVRVSESDLSTLRDCEKAFKIPVEACWSSEFGIRIFYPYNAAIDPRIDCFVMIKKSIAARAASYHVPDIVPLARWKDGVVIFSGLRVDGWERENIPMLIADLQECDIILGRKWLEDSHA